MSIREFLESDQSVEEFMEGVTDTEQFGLPALSTLKSTVSDRLEKMSGVTVVGVDTFPGKLEFSINIDGLPSEAVLTVSSVGSNIGNPSEIDFQLEILDPAEVIGSFRINDQNVSQIGPNLIRLLRKVK